MNIFQIVVLCFIRIQLCDAKCGYESCPVTKPDKINVHLVPHTHDDVGWLKTVDQYYYGARNDIQHAGVQYILDSVMVELNKDPSRRFIYVESAFFERWWKEQDDKMKNNVKQLVNNGQLEFINGGWCMNDEAGTHYSAVIDQMTYGLRFLKDTFGKCGIPRVAWQIDPFGHSREQASMFAQMGFDAFFFSRLDYIDKSNRLNTATMEQVWHADPNQGNVADIFFGALYAYYNPPPGFCFDQSCTDPPIQDDPRLFDYNVDERVNAFVSYARNQAQSFATNNIIMTMGSDFQYENANINYKNMDKLIKYTNAKENETGIHLLYSTPSCYLYSLNQAGANWTTKHEDFFPYANNDHTFWTGYFTSRPGFKGYERSSNNFLQVCKQIEANVGQTSQDQPYAESDTLQRAMGVAQHHDAVTGTAKQHVNDDYTKRLAMGVKNCQNLVGNAMKTLLPKNASNTPPDVQFCNYLNVTICAVSENSEMFSITAYNPLARSVTGFVRVPVNAASYHVTSPSGKAVTSQIIPVSEGTKSVRRDRGNATYELVIPVSLSPLGYSTYQIQAASVPAPRHRLAQDLSTVTKPMMSHDDEDLTIDNKLISLTFDGTTGLLKSMTDISSKLTTSLKQSYMWYNSSNIPGDYLPYSVPAPDEMSGAYIFRPNSSDPFSVAEGAVPIQVIKGSIVQEVHQQFSSWLTQVVRLYKNKDYVEFEWTVGPVPIQDGLGKEVISRFESDIDSGGSFYTDSNGRQMLHRRRNWREDFKYRDSEPSSGNYYPVNSRIFIKDSEKQLTILTDRSQGGSSLHDGEMELMLHRRMLRDDFKGVDEPLNEKGQFGDGLIVRGKHYLLLTSPSKAAYYHRTLAEEIYMAPSIMLSEGERDWREKFNTSKSLLTNPLPPNVHLLTLEQWTDRKILLRLEHQFEMNEDKTYSKSVTVSLKDLFVTFDIVSVEEQTLAANQLLKSNKRLKWSVTDSSELTPPDVKPIPVPPGTLNVTLNPMQIRTFIATIQRK